MATNLALDDRLIEEARRIGRHKTKKEAVTSALTEYVKRRKRLRILEMFGTVEYDPHYDYKAERLRGDDSVEASRHRGESTPRTARTLRTPTTS